MEEIKSQIKFCNDNKLPQFFPTNGICWNCGKNIFEDGFDLEYASSQLITSCPHCYCSYCD